MESQVMSQARKFEGLKADAGAPLPELGAIEEAPRSLVRLAAENPTLTAQDTAHTSGE
jgi:hypothetical protein